MNLKIALVGNPNSGKTTLFNQLTGSNQYVGNWPGVTVEKKEGKYTKDKQLSIIDLPGIYSLSPYSLEEVIARNYLLTDDVDVVINIIDATNLERNLYLTTQLLELQVPVVIALNMIDLVNKDHHIEIDVKKLEATLHCPVVAVSATKNIGIDTLIQTVKQQASMETNHLLDFYSDDVNQAINHITALLPQSDNITSLRFLAIKYLENDQEIIKEFPITETLSTTVSQLKASIEAKNDDDIESIITNQRYQFIVSLCDQVITKKSEQTTSLSDKIDRVVTSRIFGLPIFALVMFLVYYLTIGSIGDYLTSFINDEFFPTLAETVATFLQDQGTAEWLQGLIVDGFINGVGAVLGFVPQIFILFFLISILEDCGYMSRIAFIMDRIFRRFGLSGKSFIPMLIGSGCSVPAIMATRTIESERDRRMTIMLTPFIICSAKLPVFTLLIGAFFPNQPWLLTVMYFTGMAMIIICGIILKQFPYFKGTATPFVMEMPKYHLPRLKNVLLNAYDRAKAFVVRAGTVIFVMSGLIWFLNSFDFTLNMVESEASMLASIGNAIAPIFAPLGFGNWQATVATITGLLAKETVVATFGILFGLGEVSETDPGLLIALPQIMSQVGAYAFMIFTLFAAPCIAAIGATKREMGGWKWTFITLGFQTGVAYVLALLVYQIGSLIF